jgi:hypothetical protein
VTRVVVVPIVTDLVDVVGDARTSITRTDRSDRCNHQQASARADHPRGCPRFWLNLQAQYDLDVQSDLLGDRLDREVTRRAR